MLDSAAILLIILAVHDRSSIVRWRVHVWIGQKRLDRRQDGAYIVDGRPGVLKDVEANAAIRVDIRVEHLRQELHFGCLVRVLLRELNRQVEAAAVPNGILGPKNYRLPVEERVTARCGLDGLLGRVFMHFLQVFQKTSFRVRTHIV